MIESHRKMFKLKTKKDDLARLGTADREDEHNRDGKQQTYPSEKGI